MARTALFATLLRIARDHAEAKRGGIAVEAVREQRTRSRVSRRAFLAAAAGAAASFHAPVAARAGANPRVAIIGGGVSGLAAALTLADASFTNVTVYEATSRLGGRMFSNSPAIGSAYWADDQVTEWCGELIDSAHVTIQGLAKRYDLPLDDLVAAEPMGSTPVYYFDGAYYTLAEVDQDFAPVFAAIQSDATAAIPANKSDGTPNTDGTVLWDAITAAGVTLDNMSVHDWIVQKVPGGASSKMGKLLDAAYASEYGADTTEQSSLNMVLLLSGDANSTPFYPYGTSDERYHVRGGNQQIPLAIAKDLQTRLGASAIQLNQSLTKIATNPDGSVALTFTATASSGATTTTAVTADAVILALPFAVLAASVDFKDAGFDARKTTAIQQLGKGLSSKLQLQFTSRLWNQMGPWGVDSGEETFSDNGNQCSWDATRAQSGASGILCGYTGGSPTVLRATTAPVAFGTVGQGAQGASIATLTTTFLGQLEQIFPGITPLYGARATLSLPHLAPNFNLAYSYWGVGQYQAFAGYERVAQGNIHFAGEHTSVNFQGYMEGGAAEGVRAAQEIIANPPTKTEAKGGGCSIATASSEPSALLSVAATVAVGAALARRG